MVWEEESEELEWSEEDWWEGWIEIYDDEEAYLEEEEEDEDWEEDDP